MGNVFFFEIIEKSACGLSFNPTRRATTHPPYLNYLTHFFRKFHIELVDNFFLLYLKVYRGLLVVVHLQQLPSFCAEKQKKNVERSLPIILVTILTRLSISSVG